MKKKIYTKPQTDTVSLRGPIVMMETSTANVNNYDKGEDIMIGDD